jgi:hypothetical protein
MMPYHGRRRIQSNQTEGSREGGSMVISPLKTLGQYIDSLDVQRAGARRPREATETRALGNVEEGVLVGLLCRSGALQNVARLVLAVGGWCTRTSADGLPTKGLISISKATTDWGEK